MRRLLTVLTHAALRLVIAVMMAAGGAALVAVVSVMQPAASDWAEWIVPIRQAAVAIGFTFLGAAVIALRVLPSRRELIRSARDPSEPGLAGRALTLLAGLAGVSVWQVPMLLAWWGESRGLLEQLTAQGRDPLGLWIIPVAILSAPPFIATVVVLLFVLTAIAVAAARPRLAVRVLRACVLLQGGLVVGSSLALPQIRGLAGRVLALVAAGPDADLLAAMTQAVARQDFFATGLLARFHWILGGYILAALARSYWQPFRTAPGDIVHGSDVTPPAGVPGIGVLPVPAPAESSSTSSSVFDNSAYRVRLRTNWILAAFRVGDLDYTITPMPARVSDPGFSFSGKDGLLRREPTGPALLTIQPEGGVWPFKSSYVVTEASSGGIIGILERVGPDWSVLDRFRRPVAQVEEVDSRRGYCRYRLRVDQEEVCRFTWAMHGLGVWTAVMDVEFSPGAARRLDPSYAMALAPILESQARRASQRRH